MMKKGLVCAIVVLFVGVSVFSSVSSIAIFNSNMENHPPYAPSNYYPYMSPVDVDVDLSWDGGDPDPGDTVTYDVYFGRYAPPPKVATVGPYPWNQTRIEYDPGTLEYCSVYYMTIVACDNHGAYIGGPVGSFFTNCPPDVEVTWEAYKVDGKWYVDFICDSAEGMSDIYRVEMYIDDELMETITGPGPDYTFTIEWSKAIKSCIFKFVFYDLEGNTAVVIIDGSDIKSYPSSQQSSTTGSSSQIVMSAIIPSAEKTEVPTSGTIVNDGSLSGYVNDTSGNPIEGALVRVYFHETYEEDYSDEDGYYHVTNIPICYCLKNATCSEEWYKTGWVLLSIVENTTHDFILTTNHPPTAPEIDGPKSGKVGVFYNYTFVSTDPNDDDIIYHIYWGDMWLQDVGPYPSGEVITVSHYWIYEGTYTIMAQAEDTEGLFSYPSWFEVTMPRDKAIVSQSSQQSTIGSSSQISRLGVVEIQNNNEMLGTLPPDVPKNPIPENGEGDVPIDKIFIRWDGNVLQNDVYFGKSNPPPLVAENLSTTWYDPGLMDTDTTYYWQIVAKDYAGSETPGPIWNFTTGSKPNHPPNAPELSAEKIGESTFIIRIKITDPDGDDLDSYAVRWDTIHFVFIYRGPFPNGTLIEEMMGYSRGWHEIKAQCADRWWQLSEWAYLEITVSRNQVQSTQQSSVPLFVQILQRLMNLR